LKNGCFSIKAVENKQVEGGYHHRRRITAKGKSLEGEFVIFLLAYLKHGYISAENGDVIVCFIPEILMIKELQK